MILSCVCFFSFVHYKSWHEIETQEIFVESMKENALRNAGPGVNNAESTCNVTQGGKKPTNGSFFTIPDAAPGKQRKRNIRSCLHFFSYFSLESSLGDAQDVFLFK